MKKILLLIGFCCSVLILMAQSANNPTTISIRQSAPTAQVFFLDDFNTGGPHPDVSLWGTDSNDVYVNDDKAGDLAPSAGVATLDEFDEAGNKYDLNFKKGDDLVSIPLDLSDYTVANQLALSFYFQVKGRGFFSNRENIFFVDFLNASGDWVEQYSYETDLIDNCFEMPFAFYSLALNEDAFFFDGFQFRFRTEFRETRINDYFNLDYVKLLADAPASPVTEDVAFTKKPDYVLDRYRAMPWNHFFDSQNNDLFADELISHFNVGLYNHFDNIKVLNNTTLSVSDGNTLIASCPLLSGLQKNVPPQTNTNYENPFLCQNDLRLALINQYATQPPPERLSIDYHFDLDGEPDAPIELAQMTQANNQVQQETIFGDHFAYDDGSAEAGYEVNQYTYGLAFHANADDQISGIMIHFAHYNLFHQDNGWLELMVWLDQMDDSPERTISGVQAEYFDPYTGFALFVFRDPETQLPTPLDVAAEQDFYVGWKGSPNPSSYNIYIGVDLDHPEAINQFFTIDNNTVIPVQANCPGAVMIRPVMGTSRINKFDFDLDIIGSVENEGHNCANTHIWLEFDISQNSNYPLDEQPLYFDLYEVFDTYISNAVRISELEASGPGLYRARVKLPPVEAGIHHYRLIVQNDCGAGMFEFDVDVEPSREVERIKAVCNNHPTNAEIQVATGTYWGVHVESPSEDCLISSMNADVRQDFQVAYKGMKTVSLFPGFHAHEGTIFQANIEEICYVETTGFTEEPDSNSTERMEVAIQQQELPRQGQSNMQLAPNPFQESFQVDLQLAQEGPVLLRLYDLRGREISTLFQSGHHPAGHHQFHFSPESLAAGIYLIELQTRQQKIIQRLVRMP